MHVELRGFIDSQWVEQVLTSFTLWILDKYPHGFAAPQFPKLTM